MRFHAREVTIGIFISVFVVSCAHPMPEGPTLSPIATRPFPTSAVAPTPSPTINPMCPGNLPSDPPWICRAVLAPFSGAQSLTAVSLESIDPSTAGRLRLLFTQTTMAWDEYAVGEIVFSPDDRYLAVASSGSGLSIFSIPSLAEGALEVSGTGLPSRYLGVSGPALAFSPDSRQIALALNDEEVMVMDSANLEIQASLTPVSRPASVAFTEDGARLVIGTAAWPTPSLQLWDLTSRKPIKEIAQGGSDGPVCDIAISTDGRILAAGYCTYSYKVVTWDVTAHYSPLATLYGIDQPPYGCGHCSPDFFRNLLQFASDGRTIASATGWGSVVITNAITRKLVFVMSTDRKVDQESMVAPLPINGIAFAANGEVLAIAADNELQIRDVRNGRFLFHTPNPLGGAFGSVAISANSRLLVTVDTGGLVEFWGVSAE